MNLLQIHEPGETPLPHAARPAVGIDLGTTHSVVAIARADGVELVEDGQGHTLFPSVVSYHDGVMVGRAAQARLRSGEPGVVASIKRLMGRAAAEVSALGHFALAAGTDSLPRVATKQGDKTAVEISADILRFLKEQAEKHCGEPVEAAVITVPAYFDDAARAATRDAARLAGLEVLRLVNEPTAAALAYGLDNAAEGVYAIYDLGGGTFDFSLLNLQKGVFQVLATAGDLALGGDDIDRAVADALKLEGQQGQALARQVKEDLSTNEQTEVEGLRFNRAELEAIAAPLVTKSLRICRDAMEEAAVGKAQIHGVVLVGGSTRMPLVRREVEAFFGQAAHANVDPDEVVAVGAALQALGLAGGGDTLLLDVTPLSLGLETMGGMVEKLIYRNSPIPVAVTQEFTTYQDGQDAMIIHVLQGEREMVEQCRSLARFTLRGIPALPAGIARIGVTLSVDADGLLSVSAREQSTGIIQQVDVKPSYGLAPEEIERMLIDSMENARGDITARLLAESRMEAGRLLEELKSALADAADVLSEQERESLPRAMDSLTAAMAGDDRELIDGKRLVLENLSQPFAERRMDRAIQNALKGSNIDKVDA